MKRISISALILCSCLTSAVWAKQQKVVKPLTGYRVIVVKPFTVKNDRHTRTFPAGAEADIRRSVIAALQTSGIFERVVDGTQTLLEEPSSSESSSGEGPRAVILSGTIMGYGEGSSIARFMVWPLPVGVSDARVLFVFHDLTNSQEVFRFETEATYQAVASLGFATKEEQTSHIQNSVAQSLVKEIKRRTTVSTSAPTSPPLPASAPPPALTPAHASTPASSTTAASLLGIVVDSKMRVVQFVPESVSSGHGLELGDIINSVDDRDVKSPEELTAAVSNLTRGAKVKIGYLRRGWWQSWINIQL